MSLHQDRGSGKGERRRGREEGEESEQREEREEGEERGKKGVPSSERGVLALELHGEGKLAKLFTDDNFLHLREPLALHHQPQLLKRPALPPLFVSRPLM